MNPVPASGKGEWPEVLATVTECKYEAGAGRALAFGLPTFRHFRISYNYFADGELHAGEFMSARAVAQGTLFPIRYKPGAPRQTDHDASIAGGGRRWRLIVIGVIGSLVFSLAWLGLIRGRR